MKKKIENDFPPGLKAGVSAKSIHVTGLATRSPRRATHVALKGEVFTFLIELFSKKFEMKDKKKLKLNQHGQAFEAYRLLIAMVIALAVLIIILSAISYFDELRKRVSQDTLYSSFKSAIDSPNGKIVKTTNLVFPSGSRYTRTQFARPNNLEEECIQLDASKDTGFELHDEDASAPYVNVAQSIQGSAYFQCRTDNFIIPPGPDTCFVYCLISFGKLPESP